MGIKTNDKAVWIEGFEDIKGTDGLIDGFKDKGTEDLIKGTSDGITEYGEK